MTDLEEIVSMITMELESLVRKAVKAEMEQFTERVIGIVLEALKSQGVGYQLVFADKLPATIFRDGKIESEKGGPIKIELVDTISKAIVTSAPLSSMKIKIVALDGDLGFDDQENWTDKEFEDKVVEGKKDKRLLVMGDIDIELRDGVGFISDLKITDNSSWMQCGKFRLGARVVTSVSGPGRIKEAISNPFEVKEYGAKGKRYPPSLDDDVWRLENIKKGGKFHQRLAEQNIHKVGDLWQMYQDHPNELKAILKCTDKILHKIGEHSFSCVKPNAIDDHNYQPPAKRSCIQEPLVKSKNVQAYENMNVFYPVDEGATLGQPNDLTSPQAEPINTPTTAFSGMPMSSCRASTSLSYEGGLEDDNHQLQLPVEKNNHPILPSDPTCGYYNLGREDGLQATCNEETVTNVAYGMTSQDPMSSCPSVSIQFPFPICEDHNTRMDGLFGAEAIVLSLADGTTSQAPPSTCSLIPLWEPSHGFGHFINDSESVDPYDVTYAVGCFNFQCP